ncbi:hypothetical protein NW249_34490 [Streptomyces sp. OUCMDZ-4982]|uniref:hypothetical protein n=1 Tax=Streptomyces sp. OUCMDZ-4982 TaxID=2973090 RepID=UPI00215B8DBE|nr:hypothetical protein [Streptomyces sp. OUCMDZ-4982]MCR8947197.1 hypothetical protein [Streptomyces sp. OUCMDZ-4982]
MSAGLLAAAEPRRTRGGAGGVRFNRPRRRSEQTVWVPESLYRGGEFCDEAVAVYVKVAALDARRSFPGARRDQDPCTARVTELAAMLGMSPSAVERGLTHLNRPGPDGTEPWVFTKQRTHRGGEGQSAKRYARLVPRDQAALEIPVRVAEALSPRRLRAWLHLARATAKGLPVTAAELAGELFHHTGKSAGEPLSEKTGRRLLDDLQAAGWITLDRRAGLRGRHTVTVNTSPLHPVPAPTGPAAPVEDGALFPVSDLVGPSVTDNHDGVGPDDHDGSLATEEDSSLTPDGRAGNLSIRRRRDAGSYRTAPVDNVAGPTFQGAGHSEKRSNNSGGGTYRGPGLQLSPRVWQVLEPVRHELESISPYVLRRIGQEIGRQLSAGTGTERLTARLTARYSRLTAHGPAAEHAHRGDVGRWILGAGLVRHGCRLPSCESGTTWSTGERCHLCANIAATAQEIAAEEAAGAQRRAVAEPRPEPPARPGPPVRWLPWPPPPEPGPEPPVPDEREQLRAAATPEAVRQALLEHGAPAAIRLYGRALVLPHLIDPEHDGRTTG